MKTALVLFETDQLILERYVRSRIIEFTSLALGLLKKLGNVDDYLAFRIQMHLGPIHRPWGRTLEIDSFTVVATAVTGTLKLVFARPPVRSAAKVRAPGIDNENPVRSLVYPDAILLLPLGVDPKRIVRRKTDAKYAGWFEN